MELFWLVIIAVLIVYTVVMTVWYVSSKRRLEEQIERLQEMIHDIGEKFYYERDTLGKIDGKVSSLDRLGDGILKSVESLAQVNKTLESITPKIERIYDGIVGQRGKTGEMLLEYFLERILLPDEYQRQVSLPGGERVDFMLRLWIEGKRKNIPIDSKFTGGTAKDVKERIKEVSRYAVYSDVGFALMYVPSDDIYLRIVSDGELLEFATKNNVYMVGPTALFAFVRSASLLNVAAEAKQKREEMIEKLMTLRGEINAIVSEGQTVLRHNRNFVSKLESVLNKLRHIGEE